MKLVPSHRQAMKTAVEGVAAIDSSLSMKTKNEQIAKIGIQQVMLIQNLLFVPSSRDDETSGQPAVVLPPYILLLHS